VLRNWFHPSSARRPRSVARRLQLSVELLESRQTPATINVTTTLDLVDPNDGLISLREAISQANADAPGDVINLPAGLYQLTLPNAAGHESNNASGDLNLTQSMTIQGAGAATFIDGNGLTLHDRVLQISNPGGTAAAPQVILKSLGVQHGEAPAISSTNPGDSSEIHGGGIMNDTGCALTLDQVVVRSNTAPLGGGLSNAGTLTVQHASVFVNNRATDSGGGIFNDSLATATIENSAISVNTALNFGGGLYSEFARVSLRTTDVYQNWALNGTGGGLGIVGGSVTLDAGCQVSTNDAHAGGSGIANHHQGQLTMTDGIIYGNAALDGHGGGILNDDGGTVTLSRVNVRGNVARNGGGIANVGALLSGSGSTTTSTPTTVTLDGGNAIANNNAANGGGIYNAGSDATVRVTGSSVRGNMATHGTGGGIRNDAGGTVTLSGVTIQGNFADHGGGIANHRTVLPSSGSTSSPTTVTLDGSNVIASNTAANGGGIYNAGSDATVGITGGNIFGNTAQGFGTLLNYGGGVFNDGGGMVTLSRVEVVGNFASNKGGGIATLGAPLTVAGSAIRANHAVGGEAGGIACMGGPLNLTDSVVVGNLANAQGGGLFIHQGVTAVLSRVSVQGNRAGISGGGIANVGGALTIDSSEVRANAAAFGGGIYSEAGTLKLTASILVGNAAEAAQGGGLANSSGNTGTLFAIDVQGNSAAEGGGISNLGTLHLSGSLLSENIARTTGGGLYNYGGGTTDGSGDAILGNVAGQNSATPTHVGGGIFNEGPSSVSGLQATVAYNSNLIEPDDVAP